MRRLLRARAARRRAEARATAGSPANTGTGLEVCPVCGGPYVYAADWELLAGRWHLLLQCGQCWAQRLVTVSEDMALRFSEESERARSCILAQLEQLAGESD